MIPDPQNHINYLTPEIIRQVIENPQVTYDDLDALLNSIINSDAACMGRASIAAEKVERAITEWLYK